MRELLKNKAKEYLKEAIKYKSEYWYGYRRAIYNIFPELENNKEK